VTPADFRQIALSMPKAEEVYRRGRSKFRVRRRIFATLEGPGDSLATINLTPDQQSIFAHAQPRAFAPVAGGLGRLGATRVELAVVTKALLQSALGSAWRIVAPPTLLRQAGDQST
jgi:hypothetical protein